MDVNLVEPYGGVPGKGHGGGLGWVQGGVFSLGKQKNQGSNHYFRTLQNSDKRGELQQQCHYFFFYFLWHFKVIFCTD